MLGLEVELCSAEDQTRTAETVYIMMILLLLLLSLILLLLAVYNTVVQPGLQ